MSLFERAQAQPATWSSRGPGGGGALFSPSINPHNSADVFIACDMSELFRTTNFGATWAPLDFREMVGNNGAVMQFTLSPTIMYCINMENDVRTPMRSTDGGTVWSALAADPTGQDAWTLWADPASTTNLIVSDYSRMWHSSNGGASWQLRYTDATGDGCYIAGVFWDGASIYVGTNAGLLVSTNGGTSFALSAIGGIGAGEAMVSMTGARVGATRRLFCVTLATGDVYPGVTGADFWGYQSVYSFDVGAPNWVARTTGIAATDYPFFISMALNNVNTAWLAGGSDAGVPIVYRTTNAGANWSSVLLTTNNQNINTGWMGHQGDRNWGYPEYALGFTVSPLDASRAIITDLGMAHVTDNGGAVWHQAYVNSLDENPTNTATPKNLYYHSNGLENTSCWWMTWSSANDVFAGYSDIRGVRSQDGGETWGFNYTLHTQNTMYHITRSAGGTMYGSASTAHDIYQSTYLTDARLDGADGEIRFSTDSGATWPLLHDFANPVIWSAIDPTNTNRMFASVIDSAVGDIYVTTNLNLGAASSWTRCGTPPRTQGHPFNVHVLNDGTVVATYSGRRDAGGVFTNSSGVFVSTNSGASWTDRSHAGMLYWTKDLVIDPHDATQNTWYACVWSGWGGPPNGLGGLYRTTNRGVNWTKINSLDRVSSITIHPSNATEAYLTTETTGLFRTTNLNAGTPTFTSMTNYPFRQPERVFFNPNDENEIWVTSFGHGIRVGETNVPTPTPTPTASPSPTPGPNATRDWQLYQ